MIELKQKLQELIPPADDLLLRRIRKHVNDSMIRSIAGADYGTREEEYFLFLQNIAKCGGYLSAFERVSNEEELRRYRGWCKERKEASVKNAFDLYQGLLCMPQFWKVGVLVNEVLELSCYGPYRDTVEPWDSWRQLFACWTYLQMRFSYFDDALTAQKHISLFALVSGENPRPGEQVLCHL